MIAPPNLCGNPQLIEVKQEEEEKQQTKREDDPDYDEDAVPPPSYPLRRFRFVPTWSTPTTPSTSEKEKDDLTTTNSNPMTLEIFLKSYVFSQMIALGYNISK